MIVLGIETSCDETSVAVVGSDQTIYAQHIWSQSVHKTYGGVVPEISAREHLRKLSPLLTQTLHDAKMTFSDINGIAVTKGPGLIGSLIVGVTLAKTLAALYQCPLIGVNHLAGHLLSPCLKEEIAFPYLCLLASGGHTQIVLVRGLDNVIILSQTRDDAAGEAFDKGARMLNLGFPGGPALEKAAQKSSKTRWCFTEPFVRNKNVLDMSFSGIKTALRSKITPELSQEDIADLAAAYEKTIITFLLKRLLQSYQKCLAMNMRPSTLVIAGGVAANQRLRKGFLLLAREQKIPGVLLDKMLCTDNAAMIAWAGIQGFLHGKARSDPLLMKPLPRWPLEEGFYD